jgi:hypothetical protein
MLVALAVVLLVGGAEAKPRADFEGIWAQTRAECEDDEGPNSRTLIDMTSKEGPLYDQYEHHCRIQGVAGSGDIRTLTLSCHEFWEEFRKRTSPTRESVRLEQRGAQSLRIDGKTYVRCLR